MSKLEVITNEDYNNLTNQEKEDIPNNGAGAEYANYVRVKYDGETLFLINDAIEPEDATFKRDLRPLVDFISEAYEIGKIDGENK